MSLEKAYDFVKGKKSTPIVVAVIDSGIDTLHEDLKDVMWTNPKEIPGNGIDDDKNGYVDDVHGWNFLGGKDGRNVSYETVEITRIYNKLRAQYEGKDRKTLKPAQQKEYDLYVKAKNEVTKNQAQYKSQYEGIHGFYTQYAMAVDAIKQALNVPKLDTATLAKALDTLSNAELRRPVGGILQVLRQ